MRTPSSSSDESPSSPDSLFSERSLPEFDGSWHNRPVDPIKLAVRSTDRIPGLYVFPGILPVAPPQFISTNDLFVGGARDQVMLFSRPTTAAPTTLSPQAESIPYYLRALLESVRTLVNPHIPPSLRKTLWSQPLARQVILNLYTPGKGISPHVDLPHRYADGIVGVSLTGSCVMSFTRVSSTGEQDCIDVYLPPRTVYVLSGEARWDWAHSISARTTDVVLEDDGRRTTMIRETRVSVTYRWMKDGADELL